MPFGLLVYAVVSVPLRILSEDGLPRYKRLSAKLVAVKEDNARLRQEIEALNRDVDALRNDPEAVERIARDELGLIGDDEILFQFEAE